MKHRYHPVVVQLLIAGLASSCATHAGPVPQAQPLAQAEAEVKAETQVQTAPLLTPFEEATGVPEGLREPSNAATDAASIANFAKWSAVTTPTSGPTEIIGGYASGCLMGAKALPLESPNYIVMKPSKLAYYGDQSLLDYVTQLAARAHQAGLPRLMVEDLSHPRGGPVAKGHGSHQIGLDVDISFTLATHEYSPEERETFAAPSYVIDRKVLNSNWTKEQVTLISLGANSDNVSRIFVSPPIKKFFCENFPNAPWLYKLRPWWGHDDHMHVRLNCPAHSKTCRGQSPVDKKNPCPADLKWWFSKTADAQAKDMDDFWKQGHVKEFPRLPARCESVRQLAN